MLVIVIMVVMFMLPLCFLLNKEVFCFDAHVDATGDELSWVLVHHVRVETVNMPSSRKMEKADFSRAHGCHAEARSYDLGTDQGIDLSCS